MPDENTVTEFYTIDEVAEGLKVSKVTIYRLVESGALSCYKIKGCIRISDEDVKRYLQHSRRQSG